MEVFITLIIIAVIIVLGYLFFKTLSRSTKRIVEVQENKSTYNAKYNTLMKHIQGLPLPKGVDVDLYYNDDSIIFLKDNNEIKISIDKINSIDTALGKDISGAGAAAGFLALGLTGAALGSTSTYMIISYTSNDENKSVVLESYNGFHAQKIEKDFKNRVLPKEKKQIEL